MIQIERELFVDSLSISNLEISAQFDVNLVQHLFVGQHINKLALGLSLICGACKYNCKCFFAISTGATRFLVITFDALWKVNMDYRFHVRFVNSHTKSIGGNHN